MEIVKVRFGFTCGAFDLLHSGHIVMFEQCKQHCHYLKVGLQIDPSFDRKHKNKPVQSVYERWVQLKAVRWIDEIIPYGTEDELIELLKSQIIDIRFLGDEYKDQFFTGQDIHKNHFFKRQHNFSSSSLRKRVQNAK